MLFPIISPLAGDPYWSNVVLLMHMNGADASTTFTDATGRHTFTANGNAQVDTADYKFGGASALFDGSGDYLQTTYDSDFDLTGGDYTIELFVKFISLSSTHDVFSVWDNASGFRGFRIEYSGGNLYWYINSTAYLSSAVTTGTWYHLAFVKSGSTIYKYVNGVGASTTSPTFTAPASSIVVVGAGGIPTPGYYSNCWIDELRCTKGVARYTSDFTVPTEAYPDY